MVLEFYYDLLSQPSRAIYLFLKCAGVEFKGMPVKLMEGEHTKDEYKKKNRFGSVPFIMDDGFPLSESVAIMRHLAATQKKAERWFPKSDPKNKARVEEFLHWQHFGIRKPCVEIFLETLRDKIGVGPFTQKPMDEAKVKAAKESLAKSLVHMAEYFLKDNKKFIGGDEVSAADILCVCEFYQLHGVGLLDDLIRCNKIVGAWMDRVIKALQPHFDDAIATVKDVRQMFDGAKK